MKKKELTAQVLSFVQNCPEVSDISRGRISTRVRKGYRNIDIGDKDAHTVHLKVQDNNSLKELLITTEDVQSTKLAIARRMRDEGLSISFF